MSQNAAAAPDLQWAFGTQFFKYFVFGDPAWNYARYDLSTWARDTKQAASVLNSDNPDLSAFARRRGKLLLWHGWSDAALNALETIRYYDSVVQRDPTMKESARLFLLPGVQHCAGGAGPDAVDWLAALADWVERGQAPERLIAAKRAGGATVRTRPVCAYPQRAVYGGTGSTDAADAFVCRAP
jgi:feruloyl esterase